MAIIEAATWDKLWEVFSDKDNLETMKPDEKNFLDSDRIVRIPGDIVSVVDDPS